MDKECGYYGLSHELWMKATEILPSSRSHGCSRYPKTSGVNLVSRVLFISIFLFIFISFNLVSSASAGAAYSVNNIGWSFDGTTLNFQGQGHADEYSGHYWQYRIGIDWGDGTKNEIFYWPNCVSQACPNEPPLTTDWSSPGYPTPASARWVYEKVSNKDYLDTWAYFSHHYTTPGCYSVRFYISHSQTSGAEGADATYSADYYIITDKEICSGDSATFAVTPCGTGTFAYQWYRVGPPDVLVGTGSSLTTNVAGQYYVMVSKNSGPYVKSNTATLQVNPYPVFLDNPSGGIVEGQPDNVVACPGHSAMFEVIMDSTDTGQYSYGWQYRTSPAASWIDISGANQRQLTVTDVTGKDGYQYRVKVWFNNVAVSCAIFSDAATLTIATATTTTNPKPEIACVTDPATFKVAPGGTPLGTGLFSYQWQYSTDDVSAHYINFPGSVNSATLQFTASSTYNGNFFRAIVTGLCNDATSSGAKLTVVEKPIATISVTVSS